MSEDWNSGGTGRRRGRELSALRERYAQHRQTISRLAADAPTEHMAAIYERVTADIDSAVRKLDELEQGAAPPIAVPVAPPLAEPHPVHPARIGAEDRIDTREWQTVGGDVYQEPVARGGGARKAAIALIALAALAVLGWFAWSATRGEDDDAAPVVVEETTTVPAEAEPTPEVVESPISATPATYDFGTVAKGTRKAGRFQLVNNTDEAIPIAVSRSQCRCLWFQHPQILPPNATATLTITVDGARAKSGTLSEVVTVSSKENATTSADIEITAAVQ